MESILFTIDALTMVVLVFFSVKNDILRRGARQVGLFATRDPPAAAPRQGRAPR